MTETKSTPAVRAPGGEITPAEWEVMRIVWTLGAVGSGEVIALLQQKRAWGASTIKTLLGRLVKKGWLTPTRETRPFVYRAIVAEQPAMAAAATELFASLCAMKRGETLVQLVESLALTQQDLAELQAAIDTKRSTAPQTIACDCLPAGAEREGGMTHDR